MIEVAKETKWKKRFRAQSDTFRWEKKCADVHIDKRRREKKPDWFIQWSSSSELISFKKMKEINLERFFLVK